jgi:hypothetical protein
VVDAKRETDAEHDDDGDHQREPDAENDSHASPWMSDSACGSKPGAVITRL